MDRMRLSVTDVDAWHYFRAQEEGDMAAFLARMRRQEPPTPQMRAGTAFHKAMETGAIGDGAAFTSQRHRFTVDFDAALSLPPVRELKVYRTDVYDGCEVTLVGKADGVDGTTIIDHKLTRSFVPDRYLDGFQWRAYLWLFAANRFRWNVFVGRPGRGEDWTDVRLVELHHLEAVAYDGLARDVEASIADFVAMAREHLPERLAA